MFGHVCYKVVRFRIGAFGVFCVRFDVGFDVQCRVRFYGGLDIWGYHGVHVRRVFPFRGDYVRGIRYPLPLVGIIVCPSYLGVWFVVGSCLVASFPGWCGSVVAVCIGFVGCLGPICATWAGWGYVQVCLIRVILLVCIDHCSPYFARSRVFVRVMVFGVFLSVMLSRGVSWG